MLEEIKSILSEFLKIQRMREDRYSYFFVFENTCSEAVYFKNENILDSFIVEDFFYQIHRYSGEVWFTLLIRKNFSDIEKILNNCYNFSEKLFIISEESKIEAQKH